MIVFAEERHKNQIAILWKEAFGDEEREVLKYLDKILEYVLVFEENDDVCGMLSMLPVTYKEQEGRYIYAVATRLDKRGKGISTALIDFAKNYIQENNETFLVLVPQNDGLFDFYKKRGFTPISCIEKRIDYENFKICESGEVKTITAENYLMSRDEFFKREPFIKWDESMLVFAQKMYNGDFVSVSFGGEKIGTAFCTMIGNELHIKELLSNQSEKMVRILKKEYGVSKALYACPSYNDKPFAMTYPEFENNVYFNIALD